MSSSSNKYSLRRDMCVSCTLPVIRSCTAHVAPIWFTILKGPNLFGNSFPLGGPRRIPESGKSSNTYELMGNSVGALDDVRV